MCHFNTQAITPDAINVLELLFSLFKPIYVVLRGPSSTTKLKTELQQTEILWSPLRYHCSDTSGIDGPTRASKTYISF